MLVSHAAIFLPISSRRRPAAAAGRARARGRGRPAGWAACGADGRGRPPGDGPRILVPLVRPGGSV